MPIMMPHPVMKASSSTSAGPAAAASDADDRVLQMYERVARNGGDAAYSAAFVAWALLVLACLAAWTLVASEVMNLDESLTK